MNIFINHLFQNPGYFFIVVFSVMFSVCVHEFCHAFTALKCGDSTAADSGHLTLNPLKQMGVFSLVMLLLLGFCWGAVPVNRANLTRGKSIIISLAGPLANLGLFVIGVVLAVLTAIPGCEDIFKVMLIFAQINMLLFCINLLPVNGFDGGNIVAELLPMHKLYSNELGKGVVIGMMLLFFCSLDYIFSFTQFCTVEAISRLWSVFHG